MGVVLNVVLLGVALLAGHLLSVTEPSFSPVAHVLDPLDVRVEKALAGATSMPQVCTVLTRDAHAAEDFAFAGDWAYTSFHNGTIIRFDVRDAEKGLFRSEVSAVETKHRQCLWSDCGVRLWSTLGHVLSDCGSHPAMAASTWPTRTKAWWSTTRQQSS